MGDLHFKRQLVSANKEPCRCNRVKNEEEYQHVTLRLLSLNITRRC